MSRAADRWFPLHVGDFSKGILDLSPAEIGAYVLLLMFQWDTRGPIPDDEQTLANIAKCTLEEWRACARRLLAKFHRVAGGWLQLRQHAERRQADARAAAKSAAGRAGAAARYGRTYCSEPQQEQPYLDGLEPVDNFDPGGVAEMTPADDEMHNRPAEQSETLNKDGRRMADAWRTHAPIPSNRVQDLYDQHAQRMSRVHAREARADACAQRARACAREAGVSAAHAETLLAAVAALEREGVRVHPGDPALAALVAAGVPPDEFAAVARDVIEAAKRRVITSPSAWTFATIGHRRRQAAALEIPALPAPDWHATRASMDAHARTLGRLAWGDWEREHMARGVTPRHWEWLRDLEAADASIEHEEAAPA